MEIKLWEGIVRDQNILRIMDIEKSYKTNFLLEPLSSRRI